MFAIGITILALGVLRVHLDRLDKWPLSKVAGRRWSLASIFGCSLIVISLLKLLWKALS